MGGVAAEPRPRYRRRGRMEEMEVVGGEVLASDALTAKASFPWSQGALQQVGPGREAGGRGRQNQRKTWKGR